MEKERGSSEEKSSGEVGAGSEKATRAGAATTGAGETIQIERGEACSKSRGGREGVAANQTDADIQEIIQGCSHGDRFHWAFERSKSRSPAKATSIRKESSS